MGKRPTESELKYGLEAHEYARVRAHFRRAKPRTAELRNVYFDDPETLVLRKRRMGLRIRFTRGKAPVMTLKYAAGTAARGPRGFKVRHEHEARLSAAAALAAARGRRPIAALPVAPARVLRRLVPKAALDGLAPLGSMKMRRTRIDWEGLVLELDRYEIRRQRFHELEIETEAPREADRLVRRLFKELGIRCRPVQLSKLGRFFLVLKEAS